MTTKSKLESALKKRIIELWPHTQHAFEVGSISVDVAYPPEPRFGHYTTNVAMRLSPIVQSSPREVADKLIGGWKVPGIEKLEVAGPGFMNFTLSVQTLRKQVKAILTQKHRYGSSQMGKGKRVNVEFISANPTGPLTLGNGRGTFMGDTLSSVLQKAGYTVAREYYVNDMGNQVNILAESVLRRYWQSQGIQMEYPEYCYQGQYVENIARSLYLPNYKLGNNSLVEIRDKIKGRILKKMIGDIQKFVKRRLGITYTKWFSEKTLYTTKKVDRMLDILRSLDLIYEQEGAVWLRTQKYGDEKDRVLIRSNGDATYFLPDIAYHYDKLTRRKFHKVINFIGADHAGYAPRMYAAIKALGHEGKLTLIVFQLVRLLSGGQEVRMSKRRGTFVTLEELIDDVGVDAARYFFLMYAFTTHMDFDLDLAKKKSRENPVYYVQYAHARICSILKKAKKLSSSRINGLTDLHPSTGRLMAKLLQWPEVVEDVATTHATQKLPTYAHELATIFHDFYTNVRVIDGEMIQPEPFALVQATKIVLADVLGVMGISVPEKM
ncbi:MAG: arginine--tRNA ligase [Parcubacteria group bacterium]